MKDIEKADIDRSFKKCVFMRERNFDSNDITYYVLCIDNSDTVIYFK